ncbi:MAG: M20/M25/M40 family metallo-hydrolase, partial [Gemmatimonadetes bacterium]|nr:M20/M25/M40 family metallo-hydrolase [Gemmatimonadota bacterium]
LPGLLACGSGVSTEAAVASISDADYLSKISVIADDSMRGRANLSPEITKTAEWVASQFQADGLKPGGDDGTFIQHYTIARSKVDFEASSIQVTGGPALAFGKDMNFGRGAASGTVTGGVVLVVGTPDSSQAYPAEQVKGKHVIFVPAAAAPQAGRQRVRLPAGLAEAAPASVITMDRNSDEDWAAAVDRTREQIQSRPPWGSGTGMASFTIREGSLASLMAAKGISAAALKPGARMVVREVPGLELTLTTATQDVGSFEQPNTVGILEGSDPQLKNEYLVFSAHMDHTGVGRPNAQGDSINNGADDDGSGTIAVVELAEAFSMLKDRPARSIVFLAVSGEESGLWGSRHFAEHPVALLDQIVADLNADMISRNATDSIVVIGKEHSDLGATMNRVHQEHPELNLTAADDIWPEENFYRRSDHFNFARRGVPILFFFCGTTEDYHQPSDEISKMDVSKATRTTKLMFHLGMEVANAAQRPQWNPESRAQIVDNGGTGGR